MSSRACRYLIALSAAWARLNSRISVSVLTGARDPRLARKALKSRLNPYFSTTEQFASLAFVCSRAAQMPNALSAAKLGTFTCVTNAPANTIAADAWSMTACVAADQTHGGLDADEHVLVRRAEDRP